MADDKDDGISIFGKIKDKLVGKKQAEAAAGKHLTGASDPAHKQRLPPGQRLVEKWPVLDLGLQPQIPHDKWKLEIDGAVENPVVWSWADFMAQPQFEDVSDIHCVTTWSLYDNKWQGVSAKHLIATVKPKATATHLEFASHDGYTTNVPLSSFDDSDV
ncbi:MAG TPA: molybdopterin-dependent oxidoreductase, partial [Alphaproteobacteria bacterium]|nr:molybdopterin-dependent oxidoreductase [Alphaproteobacteria bacterium]